MATNSDTQGAYRIGAVARLTGISPDTLRIWERRYDIVEPRRTPKGGRLYSQQDVTRLTMIKTLVDQGYAISTVASLPAEELNRRLNTAQPANLPPVGSGQYEVCVVGQAISVRACNTEAMPEGLELAGAYTDLDACATDGAAWAGTADEAPILCDSDHDGDGIGDVSWQYWHSGALPPPQDCGGTPQNFYIDQGSVIYDFVCGADLSSAGIAGRILPEVNPETCE